MGIQHTKGNRSPSLADTIRVDGVPFALTTSTVKFKMRAEGSSELKVDAAAVVTDAPNGAVRYDWAALDVDTTGDFLGWWEVTLPSTKTQDTPEFEIEFVDHVPGSPELIDHALVGIREARAYAWRNENDASRDEVLIDAINYVSDSTGDYCEREFTDTTAGRSGTDGVTDGTTTFVAASGAFTADDEGALLNIAAKGYYRIVTFTNGTTVVLDGSPSADTALAWSLPEARIFALRRRLANGVAVGEIDLVPFDLRTVSRVTLYPDRDAVDQQPLAEDEFSLRPVGGAAGDTFLGLLTIAPALSELQPGFGWQASVEGEWGMAAVPEAVKLAALQWIDNIVKNPGSFASQSMAGYTVTPEVDFTAARAGMPPAVRYRLSRYRRLH